MLERDGGHGVRLDPQLLLLEASHLRTYKSSRGFTYTTRHRALIEGRNSRKRGHARSACPGRTHVFRHPSPPLLEPGKVCDGFAYGCVTSLWPVDNL